MTAIINATLVMRDHFISDGVLFIEDGKIADFGEMRKEKRLSSNTQYCWRAVAKRLRGETRPN